VKTIDDLPRQARDKPKENSPKLIELYCFKIKGGRFLQGHGYATRLIGKWGLDGNYAKPKAPGVAFPTVQGFDGFYGQSDQYLLRQTQLLS
jgi:hypothetical protein